MDPEQPYRPPESDLGAPPPAPPGGGASAITHGIIDALSGTRPWVLLIAVMMLLGCALMVLAGIAMMFIGGASGDMGPLGAGMLGGFYVVFSLLYLVPAVHLLRYAAAIKDIGPDTPQTVELALRHQRSFWRFCGIMTLAVIGIYVVIIIGAIIAGIAAA